MKTSISVEHCSSTFVGRELRANSGREGKMFGVVLARGLGLDKKLR